MNINMLRDADDDSGFYAAVCAANPLAAWGGAALYASHDGGASYHKLADIAAESIIGYTTNALGNFHSGNIVDELNSINVILNHGTLSSISNDQLLAGANLCVLGQEILCFRDATLESNGSYTLRGLLRGRRGSEYAMGSHAVEDRFVLVDLTTIARVPHDIAWVGIEKLYKAVPAGKTLGDVEPVVFTNEGMGLKPYAPVHLGGGRNADGSIVLKWVRRNRTEHTWRDGADVPMTEAAESYAVEIYADGTYAELKRTISGITEQQVTYSVAQQLIDFGSLQSTVYFRVAQVSATVGAGHIAQGTAPGSTTTHLRANSSPPVVVEPEPPAGTAYVTNIEALLPTDPEEKVFYFGRSDTSTFRVMHSLVTAPGHSFENGDRITFSGIEGLIRKHVDFGYYQTQGRQLYPVESVTWVVTHAKDDTFVIYLDARPSNGSPSDTGAWWRGPGYYYEYTPYESGGVATLVDDTKYEITALHRVYSAVYNDAPWNGGTEVDPATLPEPYPDGTYVLVKIRYTVPGHTFNVGDIVGIASKSGMLGALFEDPSADPEGRGTHGDFTEMLGHGSLRWGPNMKVTTVHWATPVHWNNTVQEVDGDDVILYQLFNISDQDSYILNFYQNNGVTDTSYSFEVHGGVMFVRESQLWDGVTVAPSDT